MIDQGDVYWAELGVPFGSEPGYRRPIIVVQADAYNHSKLNTLIVCLITSNVELAALPGNVLLKAGEANLPKPSVINVSQVLTVDKKRLREKIGSLDRERIPDVLHGLYMMLDPLGFWR